MTRALNIDAPSPEPARGRRSNGRLRVRLPARLTTRTGTLRVVLCDLSLQGARVMQAEGLAPGCEVVLEWGRFDAFGEIAWTGNGRCGITFLDPIAPGTLVATREMDDTARLPREPELARQVARAWVEGTARL